MKIELADHFTYKKILLFALPSIGTMLAITSFQMADGFFVSNWLGVLPFAAVNLTFPALMLAVALGFMLGEGGSAFVAKAKGEGDLEKARAYFTLLVAVLLAGGACLGLLLHLVFPELIRLLGASEELLPYCLRYGDVMFMFLPFMLVMTAFQSMWVMAEKAELGFRLSLMQGALNVFLDWLLLVVLGWGVEGAALATGLGNQVGALWETVSAMSRPTALTAWLGALAFTAATLWYFRKANASGLHFVKFSADFRQLGKICYNGLSEMVDAVSVNIVEVLFNLQLMLLIGEVGVVAIGVYSYVSEIFLSVFFALSTTTVTVVGYKYGAEDFEGIRDFLKKTFVLTLCFGAVMTAAGIFFAPEIAELYVGYDREAWELTAWALKICSLGFFLYGFNIVAAGFFTGMEEGTKSATLAFFQSLAAPIACIYLLPKFFGPESIWFSTPIANVLAAILSVCFLARHFYGGQRG